MIHQGFLKIHQDSKVAKLGFCKKSQLNFDPLEVLSDFLESLICPLTNPFGIISILYSMLIYKVL